MKLTLAQCAQWMGGALFHSSPEQQVSGYSIDSRTLQPNELFFAVSGERLDGYSFVDNAMATGAASAVVAKNKTAPRTPHIAVDDPLQALQRLSAAVRQHWAGTLIGLTGSAGKTTTKEMTAEVLSAKYRVLKSAGNLNNHFGVPLQLLRLEPEYRYAVIELGMSAAGEIAFLAQLAAPDWGLVTNVGFAHALNFPDGIEGISRAKQELIGALPPDGLAFLNADDARVSSFAQAFPGRSIFAGCSEAATVRVRSMQETPGGLQFQAYAGQEAVRANLQFLGAHNATNAALALAVGLEAGITLEDGARALSALAPSEKRGQVLSICGAKIINDSYNSNPAALQSMIRTLRNTPAKRRILIAGEMLELGAMSPELHEACGRQAFEAGIDIVIGVQGEASSLVKAAKRSGGDALFFENTAAAGAWLQKHLATDDAVLVKGSRGVRLEQMIAMLASS